MVQGDQIEVAGQPLHPPQKLFGILPAVVDPLDHGVLKGDAPGGGLVIPAAGIDQLLAGIGLVHRHNGIPHGIIGRMEGHRQGQLQIALCQLVDLRHQAAGGKADMAHGDIHALRAVHQLQEAHHIVEIVQRLSNAHEYNVRNGLTGIHLGKEHLVQHLKGLQAAHQAS